MHEYKTSGGFYDDMIGKRYNRIMVIGYPDEVITKSDKYKVMCQCDCGKIWAVGAAEIKRDNTKSCGCLKRENSAKRFMKHGKKHTRLYSIWQCMKGRCNYPSHEHYQNYGGRGIKICDSWNGDFMSFYDWAMSNGYSDDLSIDRKDNDKGYSPDNCRWATSKEQTANRRKTTIGSKVGIRATITISYLGEEKTIPEWAEQYGLTYEILRKRLRKIIMPPELFSSDRVRKSNVSMGEPI